MTETRCTVIRVGARSYVVAERVVAIVSADTAPIRRAIREGRDKGVLFDVSLHRELRTLIVLDSGQIVASYLQPEVVARRLTQPGTDEESGDEQFND